MTGALLKAELRNGADVSRAGFLSQLFKVFISVGGGEILSHKFLNLIGGREGLSNGNIMVIGVDDGCQVFAHIRLQIPLSGEKIRISVV